MIYKFISNLLYKFERFINLTCIYSNIYSQNMWWRLHLCSWRTNRLSVERVADFQCKHKGKYTMNVIFNLYMYPLHGKTAVYFTNDVLFSYKCKTPSILKRSGSFCLFFFFLEESEDVQNFKKDDRWTTHDDEETNNMHCETYF